MTEKKKTTKKEELSVCECRAEELDEEYDLGWNSGYERGMFVSRHDMLIGALAGFLIGFMTMGVLVLLLPLLLKLVK